MIIFFFDLAKIAKRKFLGSTYEIDSVNALRINNCNFAGLVLYPNIDKDGPAHDRTNASSG